MVRVWKHWRKTDASTFFTVMNICCDQLQKALQYEAMVMPGAQQITENVPGNFSQNMLRCSECQNAVIDSANLSVYQKLYEDLKILQRSIKNQSSQKRISSDITHCKRVMLSFGINLNDGDTDEPQT
jgi:hypothetical protein